jgi:hypothetical protein
MLLVIALLRYNSYFSVALGLMLHFFKQVLILKAIFARMLFLKLLISFLSKLSSNPNVALITSLFSAKRFSVIVLVSRSTEFSVATKFAGAQSLLI